MKAQHRAEGNYNSLRLINDNLAPQLTNRALDMLKGQAASAEADMDKLWADYEDLILLMMDQRQALSAEFVDA